MTLYDQEKLLNQQPFPSDPFYFTINHGNVNPEIAENPGCFLDILLFSEYSDRIRGHRQGTKHSTECKREQMERLEKLSVWGQDHGTENL